MARVSVDEVLAEIAAKVDSNGKKSLNRFNRKNFDKLVTAAANDPGFMSQVAKISKKELSGFEEIACGKEFRKWVRSVVEKAGIDPAESGVVESADFAIPKMDWMYDFFAEVMWLWMQDNKFDLPKKEGFEATLSIKDVEESVVEATAKNPLGGTTLGVFETTKRAHKVLTVKSSCPAYLKSRRKVRD